MASEEREPITEVWGQSPQRDPGQGVQAPLKPEADSILAFER